VAIEGGAVGFASALGDLLGATLAP
jgi:hypothetical protein